MITRRVGLNGRRALRGAAGCLRDIAGRLLRPVRGPVLVLAHLGDGDDLGLVSLRPAVRATSADELSGQALAELYRDYRLSLVRLAVLLVGDQATAEDVVQDAFTAVWRRRSMLDEPSLALPYIRRAVVNRARSVLRRQRVADAFRPDRQLHEDSAEHSVLLAADHREVLTALRRLGARQRELLVLRYWSGLSEAEIAETMGISRGAVKSMAHRALVALRKRLDER